jgi:hypothetical protein
MQSVENQPTIWRNTPPLSSGLNSKASKKPAGSSVRAKLRRYVPPKCRLTLSGLNGIIFQKAEFNTSDIDCRVLFPMAVSVWKICSCYWDPFVRDSYKNMKIFLCQFLHWFLRNVKILFSKYDQNQNSHGSWDSLVGIATGYGLDHQGKREFESR